MKIVMIHGQNHIGTTCTTARKLIELIDKKSSENNEIKEFFLPRDFDSHCVGCFTCFDKEIEKCPHYLKLEPIRNAILESDIVLFSSPVYVYHITGQLKSLLDHFGTWWLLHRPEPSMINKQFIVVSTTAGGGLDSTIKDVKDSLKYWGGTRIYSLGFKVGAKNITQVKDETWQKIDNEIEAVSDKILKEKGKKKVNFFLRSRFTVFQKLHRANILPESDHIYWEKQGWLGKKKFWE